MLGPLALTSLRERSIHSAIERLAATIDPERFVERFHAPPEHLDMLVQARSVTIAKLMEIAPAGTIDPTSNVYNSTMYLMAALLGIALVANLLVRPVDPKHHVDE